MNRCFKRLRGLISQAHTNRVSVNELSDTEGSRSSHIQGQGDSISLAGLKDGYVCIFYAPREPEKAVDYGYIVYTGNSRCVELDGTDYQLSREFHGSICERSSASIAKTRRGDRVGLFVDRWMGNYYHWMLYCVPKIVLLNRYFGVEKFFVPSGFYSLPRFAQESVHLLGMSESALIPITSGVHGAAELCVVHGASPSPLAWKITRKQFLSVLETRNRLKNRVLFLTRNASIHNQRVLTNETEVIRMCNEKGIEVIDPGQSTLAEQIILFNEARVVISLHGAALTNIMWMQPGGKVIEIATGNQPHYMSLAEHFGHEWISIKAKRVDDGRNGHNGLFCVETVLLEGIIDYCT